MAREDSYPRIQSLFGAKTFRVVIEAASAYRVMDAQAFSEETMSLLLHCDCPRDPLWKCTEHASFTLLLCPLIPGKAPCHLPFTLLGKDLPLSGKSNNILHFPESIWFELQMQNGLFHLFLAWQLLSPAHALFVVCDKCWRTHLFHGQSTIWPTLHPEKISLTAVLFPKVGNNLFLQNFTWPQ